jgi:hypothetical protein
MDRQPTHYRVYDYSPVVKGAPGPTTRGTYGDLLPALRKAKELVDRGWESVHIVALDSGDIVCQDIIGYQVAGALEELILNRIRIPDDRNRVSLLAR